MRLHETVELQTRIFSTTASGLKATALVPNTDITVDIQPKSLSPDMLKAYGVSTLPANIKQMFYDARITLSELSGILRANGELYEVRGVNVWGNHGEALLFPIVGALAEARDFQNADATAVSGCVYYMSGDAVWVGSHIWKG